MSACSAARASCELRCNWVPIPSQSPPPSPSPGGGVVRMKPHALVRRRNTGLHPPSRGRTRPGPVGLDWASVGSRSADRKSVGRWAALTTAYAGAGGGWSSSKAPPVLQICPRAQAHPSWRVSVQQHMLLPHGRGHGHSRSSVDVGPRPRARPTKLDEACRGGCGCNRSRSSGRRFGGRRGRVGGDGTASCGPASACGLFCRLHSRCSGVQPANQPWRVSVPSAS